jgi:dimethylaniline monooxygenase (N-oxide forming)
MSTGLLHGLSLPLWCGNLKMMSIKRLLTYYLTGTPDYPYIAEVQSYLESYCDHFGLSKHIRLSQSVMGATPVGNITGWQLKILDKSGKQREEYFDRLVLAVGECGLPLWPKTITGLENFKGQVLHSQAYKR